MKHVLCVHPCPPSPMVGDEDIVSDAAWGQLKQLKVGKYSIWALKRDMSTDPVDAPVEVPESDPTHEAVIAAERGDNPDIDARKAAGKRAVKAGERKADDAE